MYNLFRNKWRPRHIIDLKLKELYKSWIFWLILITGIAIIIRSIPGWVYVAWGCDFGIYYGITDSVVTSAEFFPPYYGWGSSYNEFPVLYAVGAIAHWVSGIDLIDIMPKLIPIFGGLTVFVFYFIVKELTENKKIALLSTLLLSVSAFHVYQLSHVAPLVMGHFFMMISLYLFIKFRKNTKYIIPLIISTLLLIMSHHFTTYILIISLIGVVFFENLYSKEWTAHLRRDIIYIVLVSGLAFSYWALVAKTVFNSFMMDFYIGGIQLNPIFVIALFYAAFFCSFILIMIIRKHYSTKQLQEPTGIIKKEFWKHHPLNEGKNPNVKSSIIKFSVAIPICLGLMVIFSFIDLPAHQISFNATSIVYSIPLIIVICLAVAGIRQTRIIKNGLFLRGWLVAIVISFFYSIITNVSAILPERHPEYILIPVSAISALGIGVIFSDPEFKVLFSKLRDKKDLVTDFFSKKVKISHKKRIFATTAIIILVMANGIAVYPSFLSLGPNEGITQEDKNAIEWMGKNLDVNTTLIATDHRLERWAEGTYNFSTTGKESENYKAIKIWASEDLDEYYNELNGTYTNYSRITHVLIDSNMKYDQVWLGERFEPQFMTNETWTGGYDKFKEQPFELIYENRSESINANTNESASWAEVYQVNWTYIEEIYLPSLELD